jgi:hypothetical protein
MNQLSNTPPGISFSNTFQVPVSSASIWRELYQCAILELDHAKLACRVVEARHAILDRAEEIMTSPSCDEHRALNAALRALRLLEEMVVRENLAA